jgi:carboxypeptidase C (cathepsin A)
MCSGNWFGGEAISLAVDYTHSKEFRAARYDAMVVDGTEYGEVRQYGNFSFARIYESGHEVPFYQRECTYCYFSSNSSMSMFSSLLMSLELTKIL